MEKSARHDGNQPRPYGAWSSPLTPELVTTGGVGLTMIRVDGTDLYWLEHRPTEKGRSVLVRRGGSGTIADLTPPEFSVRTRVHEYGGGEYGVHDGVVFFSSAQDGRLYRQDPGGAPRPITPELTEGTQWWFADPTFTPDGRFLICVREVHDGGPTSGTEPRNELVALPTDGSSPPRVLTSGHDFYSFPRVSPDGKRLTWTTWDHPAMPWDGTELWLADLDSEASLGDVHKLAGGPTESLFQPEWTPDGQLIVVSDRSGWWNLYKVGFRSAMGEAGGPDRATADGVLEPIVSMDAEFGQPQWVFGLSTYAFLSGGRIVCWVTADGEDRLALIEPDHRAAARSSSGLTHQLSWIDAPYTSMGRNVTLRSDGAGRVFTVAGAADRPTAILGIDLPPPGGDERFAKFATDAAGATASKSVRQIQVLHQASNIDLDGRYLSAPRSIAFPSPGGRTAHAYYYPPCNPDHSATAGTLPPLLVESHGGPTTRSNSSFDASVQFWTSRGFAVVDVNYGGSTGYGRAYRDLLRGSWGIVDTEDCVAAALWLSERGLADPQRMAIRGGSAGGYTTLCALAFHDVFSAGASYYGVADLEALAKDTHKFESRYCDSLVGPYPESLDLYRARSPVHHTDRLSCPIIVFQGLLDPVVPPSQAEAMVAALAAKGIPYAYVTYAEERHGFRDATNVRHALLAELSFYAQVFGFDPADTIDPVQIVRPE